MKENKSLKECIKEYIDNLKKSESLVAKEMLADEDFNLVFPLICEQQYKENFKDYNRGTLYGLSACLDLMWEGNWKETTKLYFPKIAEQLKW